MTSLRGQSNAAGGGDIPVYVDETTHALCVTGALGGIAGTADTTETTQVLVKNAVQAINTATGAVTASPTANTILARLKDILSLTVLAAGTAIIGKVGIDQVTSGANTVVLAGFTKAAITTATTTLVKSGAGILHGVTINSKGTVASTVTIYDALTAIGNPIAIIDSLTLSGQFVYDINLDTGLTIVTTGTVAPNLTVSYR